MILSLPAIIVQVVLVVSQQAVVEIFEDDGAPLMCGSVPLPPLPDSPAFDVGQYELVFISFHQEQKLELWMDASLAIRLLENKRVTPVSLSGLCYLMKAGILKAIEAHSKRGHFVALGTFVLNGEHVRHVPLMSNIGIGDEQDKVAVKMHSADEDVSEYILVGWRKIPE